MQVMYSRWTFVWHRKVSLLCFMFPLEHKWRSAGPPAWVGSPYHFWQWGVSFCYLLQGWMKDRPHLWSQPRLPLSNLLHLQLHVASNITQALSFITLLLHFLTAEKDRPYETKKCSLFYLDPRLGHFRRQSQLATFKHQWLWPFLRPLRENGM